MKNNSGKYISVALSVLLIAYVIYNFFNLVYEPVKTEQAVKVKVDDCITLTGVALRSEVVMDAAAEGIVDYLVNDGDKVAKGEKVANIYASATGADVERELRETDEELSRLKSALNAQGAGIDPYSIESNIRNSLAQFASASRHGKLENTEALFGDILTGFNMRQVLQGNVTGFESRISELERKKKELEGKQVSEYKSVSATEPGFFLSYTDSLEGIATYEEIEKLTPAQIMEICSSEPKTSETSIGKLIRGYKWYYVAPISLEDATKLEKGKRLAVQFSSHLSYEVYFTVEKLETDDAGNSTVIFSCDNINPELACVRNEAVTVRLASYSGIRVDTEALRVVDGVQGVYIARGQKVAFRKINPIYTGNGYVISKIDKNDSSLLEQYDEIIIGGKKLYAGKVL